MFLTPTIGLLPSGGKTYAYMNDNFRVGEHVGQINKLFGKTVRTGTVWPVGLMSSEPSSTV